MDKIISYLPWVYIITVSLVAFFATVYDKWAAQKKPESRIRERTLFLWAVFGGSFAMYLTMQAVRHKTKHLSFMLGLPAIMVAQIVALVAVDYFLF